MSVFVFGILSARTGGARTSQLKLNELSHGARIRVRMFRVLLRPIRWRQVSRSPRFNPKVEKGVDLSDWTEAILWGARTNWRLGFAYSGQSRAAIACYRCTPWQNSHPGVIARCQRARGGKGSGVNYFLFIWRIPTDRNVFLSPARSCLSHLSLLPLIQQPARSSPPSSLIFPSSTPQPPIQHAFRTKSRFPREGGPPA